MFSLVTFQYRFFYGVYGLVNFIETRPSTQHFLDKTAQFERLVEP